MNTRRYPLAATERRQCQTCGRQLPKRSQWKRQCATCAKRAQGGQKGGAA